MEVDTPLSSGTADGAGFSLLVLVESGSCFDTMSQSIANAIASALKSEQYHGELFVFAARILELESDEFHVLEVACGFPITVSMLRQQALMAWVPVRVADQLVCELGLQCLSICERQTALLSQLIAADHLGSPLQLTIAKGVVVGSLDSQAGPHLAEELGGLVALVRDAFGQLNDASE